MADMICQHKWGRPFDEALDFLQSLGQYHYDNNRVYFLVDNWPSDSQNVLTSIYKWNGEELIELPLNPIFTGFLKQYPFKTARKSSGYTDEEYKAVFGEEKYQTLLMARIRQRQKWGQDLPPEEKAFLQEHPELVSQLEDRGDNGGNGDRPGDTCAEA